MGGLQRGPRSAQQTVLVWDLGGCVGHDRNWRLLDGIDLGQGVQVYYFVMYGKLMENLAEGGCGKKETYRASELVKVKVAIILC